MCYFQWNYNESHIQHVMELGPNGSNTTTTTAIYTTYTTTTATTATLDQQQINLEFYETYDVMTGVRIAATLGGFFGLMVILVLYKSKSKTEKAMEDPEFTAAAVAEVEEEEERQLAAIIESTAYQQLNPRRTSRRSLDNTLTPPSGWIRTTTRFSSVGGYGSLLEPPIRTHKRSIHSAIDEDFIQDVEDEDEYEDEERSLYDDIYNIKRHLNVPRRSSNITCSSSTSSYLERRDSSVLVGLPALPAHHHQHLKQKSLELVNSMDNRNMTTNYDFYYPIDIRVIQPTPGGSPSGSDRTLYTTIPMETNAKRMPTDILPKLAPLASISSCTSSSFGDKLTITDGLNDMDLPSYVSDIVFDDDTDDEIDHISTDSDEMIILSNNQLMVGMPDIKNTKSSNKSSSSSSITLDGISLPTQQNILDNQKKFGWCQETLF